MKWSRWSSKFYCIKYAEIWLKPSTIYKSIPKYTGTLIEYLTWEIYKYNFNDLNLVLHLTFRPLRTSQLRNQDTDIKHEISGITFVY